MYNRVAGNDRPRQVEDETSIGESVDRRRVVFAVVRPLEASEMEVQRGRLH